MNFKEELEQRTREAEEIIKSYLPKEEGFAKNMAEAMNYSMLSGGKRLRPVFMREVYSMFGGTGKVIEPFMAAMEMIHTLALDGILAQCLSQCRAGQAQRGGV